MVAAALLSYYQVLLICQNRPILASFIAYIKPNPSSPKKRRETKGPIFPWNNLYEENGFLISMQMMS